MILIPSTSSPILMLMLTLTNVSPLVSQLFHGASNEITFAVRRMDRFPRKIDTVARPTQQFYALVSG